ncbi:DUF5357 family protein [filamentous cyanobacterium LEGE 11480]|uniref:DUF5357 family protein n=1 Tax=Romeriopsis navalis LEGE 11480 TaxID=2777977 RepID=A0A928Z396_9CYAN|nr:DUF5357 domain-containing protein [Romeriopsis navalis]MBE9028953.1 DUF5357 family protein [Romeriopsis navalis LEGE 11480]
MKAVLQDLRKTLQPPRWDSWQTLMLMSIFSALLAGLATGWAQTLISSCGWIWLILSVWWLVYEYKKSLTVGFWFTGPWIIAALITVFLSSNFPVIPRSALLILWAPVSAAIAILPTFIQSNKKTKEPEWSVPGVGKRQGLLLLVLTHLLIACWIQFYFLLQNWLTAYPSLQSENLDRGNFVVNIRPEPTSRARSVLNLTEKSLREELKDKDWPEVERWLLETNRSMATLQSKVQERLSNQTIQYAEDSWWKITGKVTGGEYDLELQAYLQRPNTQTMGQPMSMVCRINPKTIALPPEQIALKTDDIDVKNIQKNLPRFRTIAKIECEAPTDELDSASESAIQDDAAADI